MLSYFLLRRSSDTCLIHPFGVQTDGMAERRPEPPAAFRALPIPGPIRAPCLSVALSVPRRARPTETRAELAENGEERS